jgi:hypothetical protein
MKQHHKLGGSTVATIPQCALFEWSDVEDLGDLVRLRLLFEYLPDEPLMHALEAHRGCGRNDYPVRPVWNSILAGVVFGHETIESLRRELQRNGQLRDLCGFDALRGVSAVPGSHVYSRFLSTLIAHRRLLQQMFERLVHEYGALHPDFGEVVAVDGKAINSYAKSKREQRSGDRRAEHDARWGRHEYSGVDESGNSWNTVKQWFGFTLHLMVDTTHELPIGFELTDAATNEMPVARLLVDEVAEDFPWLTERCQFMCGDRGVDDGKLIKKTWDEHQIKPVIDIRNCWQDADETKLVPNTENVVYDYRGTVSCVCPRSEKLRDMAYGGFEQSRETLKYRCPARHYGYRCAGMDACPITHSVRIPLSVDRRVFTPLPRSSYAWQDMYDTRTAVERVFSRLDTSYGFEHHTIRGLHKMRVRLSIVFCVMLAIAVGWTKEHHPELARSLLATG